MQWLEVSVSTSFEAQEAVSEIVRRAGSQGVVLEDGPSGVVVTAYFPVTTGDETIDRIRRGVAALPAVGLDPSPATIAARWVADEDWAESWKKYFHTTWITERIVVVPAWEEVPRALGRHRERHVVGDIIPIVLEPGMAFGTGTHASTALALKLIEACLVPGDDAIDVGTGTGILAVALAKLGARSVRAVDVDPLAVRVAEANIAQNRPPVPIDVRRADLLTGETEPATLIVANILPEVHERLVPLALPLLLPGGRIILSGIIDAEVPRMRALIERHGFAAIRTLSEDGWTALCARRP
ncbi:MAG: 50S ribosomal protein L11 methyltransferase [Hydrogenibacillus sp.]|nr:50S ribosomal protein L11 methyltransferase [Hydrogenibacillus sp.]